jgi:hypothetical protein
MLSANPDLPQVRNTNIPLKLRLKPLSLALQGTETSRIVNPADVAVFHELGQPRATDVGNGLTRTGVSAYLHILTLSYSCGIAVRHTPFPHVASTHMHHARSAGAPGFAQPAAGAVTNSC